MADRAPDHLRHGRAGQSTAGTAAQSPSRPAVAVRGIVESIHIAAAWGAPMQSVTEVRAEAGRGLVGDRYYEAAPSPHGHGGQQVTLVEAEAVDALARDYGVVIEPGETRRNIVTRGVPLDHFVHQEFRVGEVRLRGVSLCEPCHHLQQLTRPGVLRGLVHRGGLRAAILSDGTIRVGDPVEPV
jgi:MOSC domain-containing protein YiiM